MKKVHFFSDTDISVLQKSINEWLANNKNIEIIETGLNSLNQSDTKNNNIEKYTFYILYLTISQEAQAIEALIEQSKPTIESTEVKNDLLKPTN
ncbi:MAG TPA: hypothetical protein VN721_00890 [Flavipsychrobacter sp.]|nr:hypothetical protein [Flavipsychrobacter sp.]